MDQEQPLTVFDRPDYTLSVEFLWFGAIMHNEVHRWTKATKAQLINDLQLFANSIGVPVYAFQTDTHEPLKRKFIKGLGFKFDHYRWTDEGEKAELFRFHPLPTLWRKNGKAIQV